jgi:hypothetical protein
MHHMGVGDIKAGAGTTSGGSGKKIVYAEIAIAVVILAIVLIAKFGYNIDLLNPASGEMSLARSQGNSAGPGFKNVSQSTRIQTNEFQQSINQSPMQNPSKSELQSSTPRATATDAGSKQAIFHDIKRSKIKARYRKK